MMGDQSLYNQAQQARQNQYQGVFDVYNQAYGPQVQALNNRTNVLNGQIGGIGSAYGQAASAARSNYGAQLAQINLQLEALGPEHAAIDRQHGYYDDRQGILNNQYASNMDLNRFQQGYNQQLRDLLFREFGERAQGYDQDYAHANEEYENQKRGAWSDAIARGGAASSGFSADLSHLGAENKYQQDTVNTQRNLLWTGLTRDLAGNDMQQHTVENNWANLIYDHGLAELDTNEQQARLNDRSTELDFQARKLGLDKQSLAAGLQQGLANLNLSRATSVGQLMDSISSNNVQRQSIGTQVMLSALNTIGYG
jgi:hypothetical protein